MRHLITKLDAKFTGPSSSRGPIGSIITTPSRTWIKPIVSFRGVKIPDDARKIMDAGYPKEYINEEQKFFFDLWKAVVKGNLPKFTRRFSNKATVSSDPLWLKEPGVVHLARWFTAALAILRLRCQTANPTVNMEKLVAFICGCFAPMYFKVKTD